MEASSLGEQPLALANGSNIGNVVRNAIKRSPPAAPLHFYISSGGNAGLGCVAASVKFGYPSTIVVPNSTKPMMIEKCRIAGATNVIQHGASWQEADDYLRQEVMANDPHGVYTAPFDHQDVWDAAATIVEELEVQMGEGSHTGIYRRQPEESHSRALPDAIVCSVGGGGLFSGIMQGLKGEKTRVVAVETEGAKSLYESVKAGKLVTLPGITSIATSLGAVRVCQQALDYGLQDNVKTTLVTDAQAVNACWRFAEEERMLVEPACGATLAMAYENRLKDLVPGFNKETKVVLIVCGGSNVSMEMLEGWRKTYLNP